MNKREPMYDNRMVFRLDLNKLRRGDVILTRNSMTKSIATRAVATVIAKSGSTHYSHAMIYTLAPVAIEALTSGVSTRSIANCFYHDAINVRVLRYKDPTLASKAASEAEKFIGKSYSYAMALLSISPAAAKPDAPHLETFCSALVAAAYRDSGAPEFIAINPFRVTPGKLAQMAHFEDITDQVSQCFLAPPNIEDMNALDGDARYSPFEGQSAVHLGLYSVVSKDINDAIRRWNIDCKVPTSFIEALQFLFRELRIVNPEIALTEVGRLDDLHRIDRKLATAIKSSGLREMNEIAVAKDYKSLEAQRQSAFSSDPDVDIEAAIQLHASTVTSIESRKRSVVPGLTRSLAWAEYCALVLDLVIPALEAREVHLREILERLAPGQAGPERQRF